MPRKVFEPTPEERQTVQAMAAYGIPQAEIAKTILRPVGRHRVMTPIAADQLRKHFRQELDTGLWRANAQVAESLFRQAVGSPAQYDSEGNLIRAEQPRITVAGIFWMKTRARWHEKVINEHSGPDGAPIPLELDLANASVEELQVLEKYLGKAAAAAGIVPANDEKAA